MKKSYQAHMDRYVGSTTPVPISERVANSDFTNLDRTSNTLAWLILHSQDGVPDDETLAEQGIEPYETETVTPELKCAANG